MYDCKQASDLLGLYLDNELDAVSTRGVAEHLEQCGSCRTELELMRFQQASLVQSFRSVTYNTDKLRDSVEAATSRKRQVSFFDLRISRVPVWALTVVMVVIIGFMVLFFLPGRMSNVNAHPLYQAAGDDHVNCSGSPSDPEWIASQPAIVKEARRFFKKEHRLPLNIDPDYVLVRARHCNINGRDFLHLVYETPDNRRASLFLCESMSSIPAGDRQLSVHGHTAHLIDVHQTKLAGVLEGSCLIIAASGDEKVAIALLNHTMGQPG